MTANIADLAPTTSPACTSTSLPCPAPRPADGLARARGPGPDPRHAAWQDAGDGLLGDPGNQAADARLRAGGLARRPGRLDRGEVPCLERLRRRRRAHFTKDQLLTNITLYWVTATATSSTRLYYEMRQAGRAAMPSRFIAVPTGIAHYPGEITQVPRAWAKPDTTSPIGPTYPEAAISRPWRCPTCSSETCATSSAPSPDCQVILEIVNSFAAWEPGLAPAGHGDHVPELERECPPHDDRLSSEEPILTGKELIRAAGGTTVDDGLDQSALTLWGSRTRPPVLTWASMRPARTR